MRKVLSVIFLSLFFLLPSTAQVLRSSWSNEVSIGGGYCTNEHFSIEASYFWFPIQYIGVGGYLGMHASAKDRDVPWGPVKSTSDYNQWILTAEHSKVTGFTLTPSVIIQTPALKIHALKISLRAIPGVVLSIPKERVEAEFREVNADKPVEYSNYKYQKFWLTGEKWAFWSGKAVLHLAIDELCFGLGYGISNYDIWSTRRSSSIEGTSFESFYPEAKPFWHNFFLYVAWKF